MSEAVDPALVFARFVVFGLAILIFGGATFAVYAPPEAQARPRVWTSVVAPLVLAIAATGYVGLLARQASGDASWPPLSLVAEVCASTGFGRALAVVLVAGIGLAALGAFRPEAATVRTVLSAVALAALGFVGHAADDGGARGAARLALMAVHLLAIGAWLGALPWLWRAVRDVKAQTPALLRRFGVVGGVSVALVLATGLSTLGFMLGDAPRGLGAGYARLLIVKLTFVLGLFALAAVNRFWLTPKMSNGEDRARAALRRAIVVEQGLGLCALASVALLGQLDPTM